MQYFELILFTLTGLVVGSFVNVCIDRIPLQVFKTEKRLNQLKYFYKPFFVKKYITSYSISIFQPLRSFCFECDYQLNWYENIPVVSYFLCMGVCRKCKNRIGSKIIFTEITHGLFFFTSFCFIDSWIINFLLCFNFSFFWFLLNFLIFSKKLEKMGN